MSKLWEILNAPWAISPERLEEIRGIYETHLRGEKIDIKAVEAALGRPINNQPKGYEVIDGTAVIAVEGVISKRMNLFSQISGGVSTELLARDFRAALQDPAVKSIILKIDSPGGSVDGTSDLADLIFASRGVKPITAFTDGMMCSAAYWIGSAADRVIIANDTTVVGSIGVIAAHTDKSKASEQAGLKTTVVYAGKYKAALNDNAPLTDAGLQTLQERVDYVYGVFVESVAKYRGVSVEKVLTEMSTEVKNSFSGKQAIAAGLVDGVSTFDALVASMSAGGVPAGVKAMQKNQMEAIMADEKKEVLTAELLKEAHPDVFKAVFDQGAASGAAEGAKAERERIQGVFSTYKPGRENLVKEMMFDGKSTKESASAAILVAQDARMEAMAQARQKDAEQLNAVPAAEPGNVDLARADSNVPVEERAKKAWDASGDLRAEFGNDFAAYLAYAKNAEAGNIKLLRGGKQ